MLRNWVLELVLPGEKDEAGREAAFSSLSATEINDTHKCDFFLLPSEKPVLELLYF